MTTYNVTYSGFELEVRLLVAVFFFSFQHFVVVNFKHNRYLLYILDKFTISNGCFISSDLLIATY